MARTTQPPLSDVTGGTIIQFLRRNLFTVRLRDGQEVTAVMPERLIPFAVENVKFVATRSPCISVEVLLCEPPKMHRIISARLVYLCG